MFTFHWGELLVVVIGGLILLLGLALLVLRRRNEVLQDFLTPEEPNLEEEFFRVRQVQRDEVPSEEDVAEAETVEEADKNTVRWGMTAGEQH